MLEVHSLVAALRAKPAKKKLSVDSIFKEVSEFDNGKIEELIKDGCQVFAHVQKNHGVLYAPMGWITVERSTSGMILMGIRRSYMVKGKHAHG